MRRFILHSFMLCNARLSKTRELKCAHTILQPISFFFPAAPTPNFLIHQNHLPQPQIPPKMLKSSEKPPSMDKKSKSHQEEKRSPSIPPHGTKEWLMPREMSGFLTFIDHNCTLDLQGYPLYPNGYTIFVKLPGKTVTNFGSVGFTKRTCTETPKGSNWKIRQIYCLGVMVCDNPECEWAGSPPTGSNGIQNFLERYDFFSLFFSLKTFCIS